MDKQNNPVDEVNANEATLETPLENSETKSAKEDVSSNTYMMEGMSIGMCLGTAFGLFFDNLALGLGCGLCLGLAIGSGIKKKKD